MKWGLVEKNARRYDRIRGLVRSCCCLHLCACVPCVRKHVKTACGKLNCVPVYILARWYLHSCKHYGSVSDFQWEEELSLVVLSLHFVWCGMRMCGIHHWCKRYFVLLYLFVVSFGKERLFVDRYSADEVLICVLPGSKVRCLRFFSPFFISIACSTYKEVGL